jgi:hypothetical protein
VARLKPSIASWVIQNGGGVLIARVESGRWQGFYEADDWVGPVVTLLRKHAQCGDTFKGTTAQAIVERMAADPAYGRALHVVYMTGAERLRTYLELRRQTHRS